MNSVDNGARDTLLLLFINGLWNICVKGATNKWYGNE